ncbi:MAG: hypothetical protein ABI462_08520 [Ignavibacteria bacterium]
MKKIILLSCCLIISAYFYSCSSVTEVTGTWKKPATVAKKYNKVAVLGISGDIVKRSAVEKAIVSQLRKYGINAVSGSNILPDSFIDSDGDGKVDSENKEAIQAKFKDQGIDGVFVISVMDVKESEHYVPGSTYYSPSSGYYPFYNYYWGTYNVTHTPGYITKSTNYFLSSNFYDLSDEQLLWSGQSETFNPQSLSDFSKSYAEAVTQDFVNSGVIKK